MLKNPDLNLNTIFNLLKNIGQKMMNY